MTFALATFPAAPRDREVGIVPRIVLLTALVMVVAGLVLLAFLPVYGVALLVVGVADVLVASVLLAVEPVAYVVRSDGLTIERRRWRPREFNGPIGNVRRDDVGAAGHEGDPVDGFVTSLGNVVCLRVGETEIEVSPADPDSFIAATGGFRA